MRWSENETYQFVKIYLSHELLWNPEHSAYRLKNKRLKAYREIIAELNETTGILLNETELKIKIKNLRSTYMQEIVKIKQRSSAEWAYKPNMKWFSEWHKCFGGIKKPVEDASTFDSVSILKPVIYSYLACRFTAGQGTLHSTLYCCFLQKAYLIWQISLCLIYLDL